MNERHTGTVLGALTFTICQSNPQRVVSQIVMFKLGIY